MIILRKLTKLNGSMTLFQETLDTIERELELSTQKIKILDSLQEIGRALTRDENEVLGTIQRTNTGILALLLEHKVTQYNEKNSNSQYEPFIIDTDIDKLSFLEFIETLQDLKSYRYDFIIGGSGKHATPVTMIRDERGKTSIFSLDAAVFYDNFSYLSLLQAASQATNVYNYEDGGIQNSAYGCTIYSIQHLSAMSKMNEEQLSAMFKAAFDIQSSKQYLGFSPKIVRNIQSISSYTEYIRLQAGDSIVSKGRTFSEYVEINKRSISNGDPVPIERNFAHTYKTHKYLMCIRDKIKILTQQEFDEVIYSRSVKKIISSARYFPTRLGDVYDLHENVTMANIVPDYQAELERRELDLTIRKLRAEGYVLSDSLAECKKSNIIEAVCRFGIIEEEAMSANCFKDPSNKGIAISFLRKAYREASKSFINNGAQLLFEIIKDNDCIENSEIKKLYDSWMKRISSSRILSENRSCSISN